MMAVAASPPNLSSIFCQLYFCAFFIVKRFFSWMFSRHFCYVCSFDLFRGCSFFPFQSTFLVLRGVLVTLSSALLPERLSSRTDRTNSGATGEKSPIGPSTPTGTPPPSANLTLLYAFLRSEEAIAALHSLQSYVSCVSTRERKRRETSQFVQTYAEQYQQYDQYCRKRREVPDHKTVSSAAQPRYNRDEPANAEAHDDSDELSTLPARLSCLSEEDLPQIPPPPVIETALPASSFKSFAVTVSLQLAPYVHYLLDLRSVLLKIESSGESRSSVDQGVDFEDVDDNSEV